MTVQISPCDWTISYAECLTCEPLTSLPASGQAIYEEMATTYLWNWTGRRYGVCELVLRPCRQRCLDDVGWRAGAGILPGTGAGYRYSYLPALIGGRWYNLSCGSCGDLCGCKFTSTLVLPGPVVEISEILIDGEVLDPSAYVVQNGRYLVRTDGGRWPTCQDMGLATDQPGTWQVSYTLGVPVPVGGQVAAGVLACELAKAACGDKSCGLPQRVQTVSRQGVTIAVLDAFDDIDQGRTGIWIIDSWIASVTKPKGAPRVLSPDMPITGMGRRQTWP